MAGILLYVASSRLDEAVRTAYSTQWVAPRHLLRVHKDPSCPGCWRLPGHGWIDVYMLAGSIALLLLLLGAFVYKRRQYKSSPEGVEHAFWSLAGGTLLCLIGAGICRWLSARGTRNLVGWAAVLELLALVLLALLVVALVAAEPEPAMKGWSLIARVHAFLKLQRVGLIAVVALALTMLFVGQTKGQVIDSMRTWTFATARGTSRIGFGVGATLLLALVVYETGLHSTQRSRGPAGSRRAPWWFWLVLAACCLVAYAVLRVVGSPVGYGLPILGVLAVVLLLLDLPHGRRRNGKPRAALPEENQTAEYVALVPLLAVAATAIAAAVDGGLSGHSRGAGLAPLFPAALLAGGAVLMTAEGARPVMKLASPRWLWAIPMFVAVAVAVALTSPLDSHAALVAAAVIGLLATTLCAAYAWYVFRKRWPGGEHRPEHGLVSAVAAVAAGTAVLFAIHADVFGSSVTLGTVALVCIALAAVVALVYLLAWKARGYDSPHLLWWLGVFEFPLVTVLVVAWIAVGSIVPPSTLHNAELADRQPVADVTYPSAPTLKEAFDKWAEAQPELQPGAKHGDSPVPMLLVAAHGGGIKAAYWTDVALDCIIGVSAQGLDVAKLMKGDDATRQSTCDTKRRSVSGQRNAARRIFIASGVSGGAVGLYVYARQLLAEGKLGGSDWVDARLNHDFASPTIGWALFHDAPNHILGLHPSTAGKCTPKVGAECWSADRAQVLADTFDRSASKAQPPFDPLLRLTWDMRLSTDDRKRRAAEVVPLLITNATVTGGNARALVSAANLGTWPGLETTDLARGGVDQYPLAGTTEVSDVLCATKDIALSTAALLGSRFPYVTPSGDLAGNCGGSSTKAPGANSTSACATVQPSICKMRLVDGGYADNSGLFTIDALWPTLRQFVVDFNNDPKHNGMPPIAPVIVELDNHYRATEPTKIPAEGIGSETLIPPLTAFGAHAAMETYARALAYRLRPPSCTVTISPGLHPGLTAPLGWELSSGARDDLRRALIVPHPIQAQDPKRRAKEWSAAFQLRRLQQWISAGGDQTTGLDPGLSACVPQPPQPQPASPPTTGNSTPSRTK